jgi:hypothetical protein
VTAQKGPVISMTFTAWLKLFRSTIHKYIRIAIVVSMWLELKFGWSYLYIIFRHTPRADFMFRRPNHFKCCMKRINQLGSPFSLHSIYDKNCESHLKPSAYPILRITEHM